MTQCVASFVFLLIYFDCFRILFEAFLKRKRWSHGDEHISERWEYKKEEEQSTKLEKKRGEASKVRLTSHLGLLISNVEPNKLIHRVVKV